MRSLLLACEEVDMAVTQRRTSQHHAMWMERRGCDCAGSIWMEEAGVWFNAVDQSAIHIEDVDIVTFGAAT